MTTIQKFLIRDDPGLFSKNEGFCKYRKILNISPGLIEVRKPFLGGLYSGEGLIFGGAYIRRAFYVSIRV